MILPLIKQSCCNCSIRTDFTKKKRSRVYRQEIYREYIEDCRYIANMKED